MHYYGLIIGVFTFLAIGIFYPIVIKSEYHFSSRIWPLFLAAGLLFLGLSLALGNVILSSVTAITGITCLWSIGELKEQTKRVERGWYPSNPNRKQHSQKAAKTISQNK